LTTMQTTAVRLTRRSPKQRRRLDRGKGKRATKSQIEASLRGGPRCKCLSCEERVQKLPSQQTNGGDRAVGKEREVGSPNLQGGCKEGRGELILFEDSRIEKKKNHNQSKKKKGGEKRDVVGKDRSGRTDKDCHEVRRGKSVQTGRGKNTKLVNYRRDPNWVCKIIQRSSPR